MQVQQKEWVECHRDKTTYMQDNKEEKGQSTNKHCTAVLRYCVIAVFIKYSIKLLFAFPSTSTSDLLFCCFYNLSIAALSATTYAAKISGQDTQKHTMKSIVKMPGFLAGSACITSPKHRVCSAHPVLSSAPSSETLNPASPHRGRIQPLRRVRTAERKNILPKQDVKQLRGGKPGVADSDPPLRNARASYQNSGKIRIGAGRGTGMADSDPRRWTQKYPTKQGKTKDTGRGSGTANSGSSGSARIS